MSGFTFVKSESQGDVTGKLQTYEVPSSNGDNLGIGDAVVITGDANSTTGRQQVAKGNTSTANTGVIAGIEPQYAGESLSTTYLPSSTQGLVRVNVDNEALYKVDVTNGPLTAAQAGQNVGIDNSAGTASGNIYSSNMLIDASTVATTSTLPYRIVSIEEDDNGNYGERAIVRVNESTNKLGATGIA